MYKTKEDVMYEEMHKLPEGAVLTLRQSVEEFKEYHYWYGGCVAEIAYKGFKFLLGAYGDVRATLFRKADNVELAYVKDKSNGGYFYSEMSEFIKDDEELDQMIEGEHPDYTLEIDNNNWWEYYITTPEGEVIDADDICDSYRFSEALNEMIDYIEPFMEDYSTWEKEQLA